MTADVDILIPIHSASRPVARAVSSVLDGSTADIRVLVIAHGVDPDAIRNALGGYSTHPSVSVVPFVDGIPSPAGPLTHGLELVTASWFAKLDSDDTFATGSVDSWLRTASATGADIVLPRMRVMPSRRHYPTPPRRPFRRVLDPVRDRIAYRTSTMGLMRASLRETARPTGGVPTGEDIAPSSSMVRKQSDREGVFGRRLSSGESAGDRVTAAASTAAAQLAFVAPLLADPMWFRFSQAEAIAAVIKVLRVHVLGALSRQPELYDEASIDLVAAAARQVASMAPNASGLLSRFDLRLLDALCAATSDVKAVRAAAIERRKYLRLDALLTTKLSGSFRREAPIRYLAASTLAAR